MDTCTILHNGSLVMVEAMLVTDESLTHGVMAYQLLGGTEKERLRNAIEAMIAQVKRPVEQITFEHQLEDCTVAELREMARRHHVNIYSADRRDDIIRKLRAEQRQRLELS